MEKNKSALVAGALNLISGVLCFAFVVLTALTFQLAGGYETQDGGQALGFVILIILFVPLSLIILFPAGIVGGVWHSVRGIIYITQVDSGKKSRKATVIFSIVLKVVLTVAMLYGSLIFGIVAAEINPIGAYIVYGVGLIAVILFFVSVKFEFDAIK
ncbi:MAG: hypothetical protein IJ800_06425 [Clostridia bacterium]|nr:hypothetical protein [Clostridia bacterium]